MFSEHLMPPSASNLGLNYLCKLAGCTFNVRRFLCSPLRLLISTSAHLSKMVLHVTLVAFFFHKPDTGANCGSFHNIYIVLPFKLVV